MSEITNTATIRVVADASGVEEGLRPAVDAARRAGQAVSQVGDGAATAAQNVETAQGRITAAVQRTTAAMESSGQQTVNAARRTEQATEQVASGAVTSSRNVDAAQRNIIASIQRTTAAMEAGGRQTAAYYELMARQRGVDPATLTPYIAQLRAVEQAQARTAASAGVSAGQISAAMRTVPAQFTDIVTAIQGGQRPLTVLLQQGGQLRDQFGSAGLAARSLGGYVIGLANPYTIAAAAAAGLAIAYKAGADESEHLRQSLILSGNAAGATASQLGDITHQVAAMTRSRDAADVVGQLVETAKIPAESLVKFSALAIDSQRILGRSVSDTVQEFAELGRSPLAALDKIDEKYHTISFSTRQQVKALLDQGKATEAATVAQEAHFRATQDQKEKVLGTLQSWEKAWINIKGTIANATNAVIDFVGGHEATNTEKIAALEKSRVDIQKDLASAKKRGLDADVAAYQAQLDSNQRDIDSIKAKDRAEQEVAKSKAKQVQQDQARKDLLGDQDILLTNRQLRQRDLEAAEQRANDNNLTAEEKKKALDIVQKKYYDVYLQDLGMSVAKLQQQLAIEELISQRKQEQVQSQLALGNITEQDSINQTAKLALADIDRKISEKRAELAKVSQKQNSEPDQQQLNDQIAQLREQRLTREQQQKNDLLKLDKQRADASRSLYQSGILQATSERDELLGQVKAQVEYSEEIGLSTTQVADLKAARLENAAALKEETAAALEAIEPGNAVAAAYREQAQALRDLGRVGVDNAAQEQMISNWKESVSQYDQVFQQGFADMLNQGKDGWSSFTKSLVTTFKTSVADELYKLFARPFVVQMVGNFLGVSQTAIAGEIASKQSVFGSTGGDDAGSAIGAAQAASNIYKAVTGGFDSLSSSVADAVQLGFDKTGLSGMFDGAAQSYDLTTGIPANGAYAGMAGTAAAYGAGMLGGHYIGNAIAGDYSVAHGQTVTNVATAVGAALLGPIGGVVGGVVGGLFNRAFGMRSKEVTAQGVKGTLSAGSLTGSNYTSWHQDGGWFRSDKNGTDTKALSDAMVAQFTQGLGAIESASSGFAKSLGVSADWVSAYSKTFDIALTGDASKDQQAITDFFSGVGDEIAKKLVPNLDSFTKSGETASATLERLAGDFQGTDKVAQLLGKSASQIFGSSGVDSAKAREALLDAAGGLSALSSEAQSFNQNFLSDAEKLAPVQKALAEALSSIGYASLQTRDDFKAAVNGLLDSGAAATSEGAKKLSDLLALTDAFAQVHPDATAADAEKAANILQERKTLQDQLDELTMSSTQLLAKQRDALDDSNKALFDQVQGLKAQAAAVQSMKDAASALIGDVDSSFSVLQKVVEREKATVQASLNTHQAAVDLLQGVSDAVQSTLNSIKTNEQKLGDRTRAQSEIRADLAITKAGGTLSSDQVDSLKTALGNVNQDASDQFSSYNDYLKDLYQTQSDIAQLGDVTDDSLSVEKAALKAAQDQLTALDAMTSNIQAQIDELKGQSTTLLSIDQAAQAVLNAISGAKANPVNAATSAINTAYQAALGRAPDAAGLAYWQGQAASGAPVSSIANGITHSAEAQSQVQQLYTGLLGNRTADDAGMQFWLDAFSRGATLNSISDAIKGSDEYKKLHPFAVGTNEVPDTMAALIHKGERIIPAADNRALMAALASPAGNASVLAGAVQSLTEQLAKQQEVIERQEAALNAIAKNTLNTADHLDAAVNGDTPLATKVISA
jgi:phage-related minor tail protein